MSLHVATTAVKKYSGALKKAKDNYTKQKAEKDAKKQEFEAKQGKIMDMVLHHLSNKNGSSKEAQDNNDNNENQESVNDEDKTIEDEILSVCDLVEDDDNLQINAKDLECVRDCVFSNKSGKLYREYDRLKARYHGVKLFRKLVTSTISIMK